MTHSEKNVISNNLEQPDHDNTTSVQHCDTAADEKEIKSFLIVAEMLSRFRGLLHVRKGEVDVRVAREG